LRFLRRGWRRRRRQRWEEELRRLEVDRRRKGFRILRLGRRRRSRLKGGGDRILFDGRGRRG